MINKVKLCSKPSYRLKLNYLRVSYDSFRVNCLVRIILRKDPHPGVQYLMSPPAMYGFQERYKSEPACFYGVSNNWRVVLKTRKVILKAKVLNINYFLDC